MTTLTRKRRRQAAWLCFEPYLSEDQRIDAIRLLENSFQTESTMGLIDYVNKVCSDFKIDSTLRKNLYLHLNQLLSTQINHDFDPLTVVLAKEAIPLAVTEEPVAKPVELKVSPQMKMFATLLYQVYSACQEQTEFYEMLAELAKECKTNRKDMEMMASTWAGNVYSYRWAASASLEMQTQFVHLVYTTVCELLGPVNADNVFHKAVVECSKLPEAKQFPPQRFL